MVAADARIFEDSSLSLHGMVIMVAGNVINVKNGELKRQYGCLLNKKPAFDRYSPSLTPEDLPGQIFSAAPPQPQPDPLTLGAWFLTDGRDLHGPFDI